MNIPLEEVNFVVVDVETTGVNTVENRVMDIACVVVRGGEIVEEFSSLVNPHQFIPRFIIEMTGISTVMAFGAPETEEVFSEVYKMLMKENTIFVAHNANFDWNFVNNTLVREGFGRLDVPRLCTIKIARRLLVRHTKTNLGFLAQYFNIVNDNRHRALGDAYATAKLLLHFLETLQEQYDVKTGADLLVFQNKRFENFKRLPSNIRSLQPTLSALPEKPGVYYFRDQNDDILYIGKAKSLTDRVHSYFHQGATHTSKIEEMVKQVQKIETRETGTELSALLLESKEIKTHKPRYNTLIKRYRRYPFLRLTVQDNFPRVEWDYEIHDDGAEYFGPFNGRSSVESLVDAINRAFLLRECTDSISPNETNSPCFYHQIKRCNAPCAMIESTEKYSEEVEKVQQFLSGKENGILDILRDRMKESAALMDFEEAATLRDRIKELERVFYRQQLIMTSVNANNVILIMPSSSAEKQVEIFFVRFGRLAHQRLVGMRMPIKELKSIIEKVYFDESVAPKHCKKEEIDEIRIIASWIHQHRESGKFLYVENMTAEEIHQKLLWEIVSVLGQTGEKG